MSRNPAEYVYLNPRIQFPQFFRAHTLTILPPSCLNVIPIRPDTIRSVSRWLRPFAHKPWPFRSFRIRAASSPLARRFRGWPSPVSPRRRFAALALRRRWLFRSRQVSPSRYCFRFGGGGSFSARSTTDRM